MENTSPQIRICPACDLEQGVPALDKGERAYCARCDELLIEHPPRGLDHVVAWNLTSLLLLVVALSHPFLAIRAGSMENTSTLVSGFVTLWQHDMPGALAVLLTGTLLPLIYTLCVLYVTVPLLFSRHPPLAITICRLLHTVHHWCMIEVLGLGVLVSLVKLHSMAELVYGPAFFALMLVLYTFVLGLRALDMERLWEQVGPAR